MAKVAFMNNNINDIFNGEAELRISRDGTKATYTDGLTQGKLVFVGSGFDRDGSTEFMSGGKIKQVLITDENNEFAFKLTGADVKARDLPHDYTSGDLVGLLTTMLHGKDKILGSDDGDFLAGYGGKDRIKGLIGDDFITGGRGDDTLTGGPGTDTFHFVPNEDGRSHDVITDFDIVGDTVDHLFIEGSEITSIREVNHHRDTLVHLGGQSTVLLQNIREADLYEYFAHV